jgi:hypothetical protein
MPNKTHPAETSVTEFLNNYSNQKVIPDCFELIKLFEKVTGQQAVMWSTMVGFGTYHYKYESGREGDYFAAGFAPSKTGITLYIPAGYFEESPYLEKLGKVKHSKACIYIKKLGDIDLEILAKMIKEGYDYITTKYI